MKVESREDAWWITEIPDTITECGPYDTRKEAERDVRGMKRFFKSVEAGRDPFNT